MKRAAGAYSVILILAVSINAQTQKVILWSDHPQGSNSWDRASPPLQLFKQIDGIEIEEVQVEGTPVVIGKPFNASTDWLRNIAFRVKNLSNQPLSFVQITLTLADIKEHPEIPYVGCRNVDKVCVQPGEEIQLTMPLGGLYDWVKQIVTDHGLEISKIDQATVKYVMVRLTNGTQWSSGCVKTANAKSPCPHS
jgi:hypothetical protein